MSASHSDDDEDDVCPLCVEVLDSTDKNFFPCPCGYQVSTTITPTGAANSRASIITDCDESPRLLEYG